MIRGFAQLFHGAECLVASHSLQYDWNENIITFQTQCFIASFFL